MYKYVQNVVRKRERNCEKKRERTNERKRKGVRNETVALSVCFLEKRKEIYIGIDPLMQQQNMTVGNMTVGQQLRGIKTNLTNY